ncbi:MAG: methyl-accepting chemotaxis protein [Rhizobiales bacterium]|nr:methyl-accepting chemotaxis protein [Hyphomicrobiales bacterium]
MLNRLSVNALLKAVISILVLSVVVLVAAGAWTSWKQLRTASRIATVSEATAHLFTALHNLRVDRSTTNRDLIGEARLTAPNPQTQQNRDAEIPALKAALVALRGLDFPAGAQLVANLDQSVTRLSALHAEAAQAVQQPKAERRAGLAQEFFTHTSGMIESIEKLSGQMTNLVKLDDAFIDQLMQLKQLAWVAREAAGDASVFISNPLAGQPLPADPLVKYTVINTRLETAWAELEKLAAGLPLPPQFAEAAAAAKKGYLDPDYVAYRLKVLTALAAGQPPGVTAAQWTPAAVTRLATLLGVADAALDAAKSHAARQQAAATSKLYVELGLLAAVIVAAAAMTIMVSRRVTGPLKVMQAAMLKLAGGDLTVETAYADRRDEIGALGGAMQTFKDSMIEADRLRGEQKAIELRSASERKQQMARLADEFQSAVGNIVAAVSRASGELETAAGQLTRTAESTQQLAGVVAGASDDASSNVQSVASAAEEMSSSVAEIGRQVEESSKIAFEAVKQAELTDTRIAELSLAASRIGDVVKLITAIAQQTNLLALNATIEAARAGESGRGFAVVAQEVKALATQTAKATDEIGTQIATMQTATQDSVLAIKEIGGTIGRLSEIASAIAAAVEQQGAATQEISRNVQEAAQGTTQVAANISDVSRGAAETGSASAQVLGSAQDLSRESNHLRDEVEKFVTTVRAA